MTKTALVLFTMISLAGCGAIAPGAAEPQAITAIHVDENGDYVPPAAAAPSCLPQATVTVPNGLSDPCDPAALPPAHALTAWNHTCNLWGSHTGVVMPYCTDLTWTSNNAADCATLDIFGVDLGPQQAGGASAVTVFHVVGSWADVMAIEALSGSQVGACPLNDPRIHLGQLSSGLPPKKPPQQGNGGGGTQVACGAPDIALDAYNRVRCQ